MNAGRGIFGTIGGALALSLILCAPTSAASVKQVKKRGTAAVSLIGASGFGTFTPAASNPRMAAAMSRGGLTSGGFRFTPSATPGSRRAVTVAIRARATTRAEAERSAAVTPMIAPDAYNLGVAVGWKRFALSGELAKIDVGVMPGSREALDVGLSYAGKRWVTKLQVGSDRSTGDQPRLLGNDQAYSVDLGGSYSLTGNLELNGGVRYRRQFDRIEPLVDDRRDSQAVYVGTAFKF